MTSQWIRGRKRHDSVPRPDICFLNLGNHHPDVMLRSSALRRSSFLAIPIDGMTNMLTIQIIIACVRARVKQDGLILVQPR